MTVSDRPNRDYGSGEATPPSRESLFVRLQPPQQADMPFMYALAVDPEIGFRWRYRGGVPNVQAFEAAFWQGVLIQFTVWAKRENEPAGLVVAYNADLANGFVSLGSIVSPKYLRSRESIEAVALFVEYLFKTFNIRKIYMEVPEFNYAQFASGQGVLFSIEARLREHDYYGGRYWDKLVLAIYPDYELPDSSGLPDGIDTESADACGP